MEIVTHIEDFLRQSPTHVVSVSYGSLKLGKSTSQRKYAFSEAEIVAQFGSIEGMIKSLPTLGFQDGTILHFRKINGNDSYRKVKEATLTFKNQTAMHQSQNGNHAPSSHISEDTGASKAQPLPLPSQFLAMPQVPSALGFTSVAQSDYTALKVKEERYNDVQRELKRVEDELSDTKSKLRICEEEKSSLRIKLDTIEERHNLNLERERMDKKSFLESPAAEKAIEALGAALPMLLQKQSVAAPALASPVSHLSQTKQAFIANISDPNIPDEALIYLQHVLNSFHKEGFETSLNELIQTYHG